MYDGRDEIARYYRESRVAFSDQRNELISLRHAGDAVIVEFWLLGTHRAGSVVWTRPVAKFGVPHDGIFILEGAGSFASVSTSIRLQYFGSLLRGLMA